MPQQPPGKHSIHIGFPLIELDEVDSTNNYARAEIESGRAQNGAAYFAHKQLEGRGQRGRVWISEENANIALTITINPDPLSLSSQFQLNFCVSVALRDFLSHYVKEDVKIKWPNDLYWKDKKMAGILVENIVRGQNWQWSIIGIGVNINQRLFSPELSNPVSLSQITMKEYVPVSLAKEFCEIFNHRYHQLLYGEFENIYQEYLNHLYNKNEKAMLRKGNRSFEATIKSVSKDGKMIVDDGVEEGFSSGEIEWLV